MEQTMSKHPSVAGCGRAEATRSAETAAASVAKSQSEDISELPPDVLQTLEELAPNW